MKITACMMPVQVEWTEKQKIENLPVFSKSSGQNHRLECRLCMIL
jgi:hypothetical protein